MTSSPTTPGATRWPSLVDDVDLLVGHGLADGRDLVVQPRRVEVADARALGQAVHGEDGRLREQLLQAANVGRRKGRRGVGQVPQRRKVEALEGRHLQQRREDRRHAGQAGDTMLGDVLEDLERIGEGLLDHDGMAHPRPGDHLAQAVAEGQRQAAEDDVLGNVAEVSRDGPGGVGHVPMREHHPFGPARGAGGVDDRAKVIVDQARIGGRSMGFEGDLFEGLA